MEQPDLPQALQLFKEMNANVQQVSQLVDNMLMRVRSGEISTDKGLGFLEMKYQMLLSYLINLTYIVLRKCSGERIESDPSIDRLIEIRTVLEKIRPIDSKLKYQIDKLVKTAVVGSAEDDPQSYRANPENLISKIDASEGDSSDASHEEESKEKSKSNIYVPPKLAAVHFDDTSAKSSKEKSMERAKKQFLNSNVLRELREEYSETPVEVSTGNHVKHAISKEEQERTEYEENYLTRLPVTKADKNRRKRLTTVGTLADEITGTRDKRTSTGKRKLKSKKGKSFKRKRT